MLIDPERHQKRKTSMLVLERKNEQSVMVGDIEVKILAITGDKVKLGISAPKEVPIYRKEIYDQIQEENLRAAAAALEDAERLKEMLDEQGGQG